MYLDSSNAIAEIGMTDSGFEPKSTIMNSLMQVDIAMKTMGTLSSNNNNNLQYQKRDANDLNNNSNAEASIEPTLPKAEEKYSLRPRSIQKRIETEQKKQQNSTASKASKRATSTREKPKPAPLSKYRRKTANARERDRMREINTAFETLRRHVPHLPAPPPACNASTSEKLTKITTLRLAMKYIAALSAALKEPGVPELPDLDCLLLESDGESLHFHSDLSEACLTPPSDFHDHSLADFTDHTILNDHSLSPSFNDYSLTPPDFHDHDHSLSAEFHDHLSSPVHSSLTTDFHDSLTPPDFHDHTLTCDPCLTPDFREHILSP